MEPDKVTPRSFGIFSCPMCACEREFWGPAGEEQTLVTMECDECGYRFGERRVERVVYDKVGDPTTARRVVTTEPVIGPQQALLARKKAYERLLADLRRRHEEPDKVLRVLSTLEAVKQNEERYGPR